MFVDLHFTAQTSLQTSFIAVCSLIVCLNPTVLKVRKEREWFILSRLDLWIIFIG